MSFGLNIGCAVENTMENGSNWRPGRKKGFCANVISIDRLPPPRRAPKRLQRSVGVLRGLLPSDLYQAKKPFPFAEEVFRLQINLRGLNWAQKRYRNVEPF